MTDTTHSHGDHDPLFYCGAQTNADGDMLPASFTVFSAGTAQDAAVQVVLGKVLEDLAEMEIPESMGLLAFQPICSWEVWAELDVSDEVKMTALVDAFAGVAFESMHTAATTTAEFLRLVWMPSH